MEHVEGILYHKLQESDFTNMYGMKKPTGGGGQTYIQAAGYSREELDRMFKDADKVSDTPAFWDKDKKFPRKDYVFTAYTTDGSESAELELAPRTGRKDYRICRQIPRYRHPAWTPKSGFPEPRRDALGAYLCEAGYPGIIDHLYILLIKTLGPDGVRYYASFVDSATLPAAWPHGVGLEEIFRDKKGQGILFFGDQYLRFASGRFSAGCAADGELGETELPVDLGTAADDAVEYFQKELRLELDCTAVRIERVQPPAWKRRPTRAGHTVAKDTDFERRRRNLKKIGDIGESLALRMEKERLCAEGRPELADKVRHVSKELGDGLGYDIRSFENIGGVYREKYIEVKSTTGGKNKPFDISANEVEVSAACGESYAIYRFFGIAGGAERVGFYEVRGSVREHFILEPTGYLAYCK